MKRKLLAMQVALLAATPFFTTNVMAIELEEVVVTAQKRAQSANDIGISITALGADDLENLGVLDAKGVTEHIPNVELSKAGYTGLDVFVVRGVGLLDENPNNTPTNSMYVDDVYLPYNTMSGFALFDADRIEVLKGPQGGLYGRNTTGGALNFVSKKGSFDEMEADIAIDVGNYGTRNVRAGIGGPITDNFAARLAIQTDNSDGYYDNTYLDKDVGGADKQLARLTLSYEPTENLSLDLRLTHGQDRSEAGIPDVDGRLDPDAAFDLSAALGLDGLGWPELWAPVTDALAEAWCPSFEATGIPGPECVNMGLVSGDGDPDKGVDERVFERDDQFNMASLNVNWDLDSMTLVSISSYSKTETWNRQPDGMVGELMDPRNQGWDNFAPLGFAGDNTSWPLDPFIRQDFISNVEAWSQEIRLVSNGEGSFNWMVGAVYAEDDFDFRSPTEFYGNVMWNILFFPGGGDMGYTQKTEAASVYGQVNFEFTERLSMTIDARMTKEEKDYSGFGLVQYGPLSCFSWFGLLASDPFPDAGGLTCQEVLGFTDDDPQHSLSGVDEITSEYDETEPSWKVNLDYRPNEDWLIYASVGRGFKSGGFFGGWLTAPNVEAYQPETNTAYEVGFKATLLEGSMQLNGSVFFYDYEDWQGNLTVRDTVNGGAAFSGLTTLGDQETTGAELDMRWLPAEGWDLRLGIGWLDTEIKELATPPNVGPGLIVGVADEFNNLIEGVGNKTPYSPELTANALIRYEFGLTDSLMASLQVDGSYTDDYYLSVTNSAISEVDSRKQVNGRIELFSEEGGWKLALWGKNLSDTRYRTANFGDGLFNVWSYSNAPRTYGVTFSYEM